MKFGWKSSSEKYFLTLKKFQGFRFLIKEKIKLLTVYIDFFVKLLDEKYFQTLKKFQGFRFLIRKKIKLLTVYRFFREIIR